MYQPDKILGLEGNSGNGKTIFSGKCGICHKSKDGGYDIGPNLSIMGKKFDQKAMLDAVINPNASIVFGHEPVKIKIKTGQVFYSFLLSEGETTVLKDALGQKVVISADDIVT